ncbi:MAG: hypothetical protein AAF202_05560 [Pseudomonadota bacterium]
MKGKDLLETLAENADLPRELVSSELSSLLEKNNLSESQVTLDQLREMLAEYLQDVFVSVKSELNS